MDDLIKTQHFTTNYNIILHNIDFKPDEAIDPFAGDKDLVKYSPNTNWILYDIDPRYNDIIKNDSLLNPPDYTNKTVITNPPYLAKNKTKEFTSIFNKYNVDDLYKASILSLIGCKNGILIIPINFFTDERSASVRNQFLSKYKIEYVNVFTKQVFENTPYNVCSFYFEQGKTTDVIFYDYFANKSTKINLDSQYNYIIGGEFYNLFSNVQPLFNRVITGNEKYITNIFLKAVDSRSQRLSLSYNDNIFIGKESDRTFATLTSNFELTSEQQKMLINDFNAFVNSNRDKYNNLLFTTFRDFGRKRISLSTVYKICSYLLYKNKIINS